MYNCINEAIKYLNNKYGYTRQSLTPKQSERLRKARNKKECVAIQKSFTDKDYMLRTNPATEPEDKYIELLIGQYYYGVQAKRELYYTLIGRGIINKDLTLA
jgi:hypothetical protein